MAEVKLTRTELVAIIRAGAQAADDGLPVTACPYSPESGDAATRVRAQAWIRGWVKATRS